MTNLTSIAVFCGSNCGNNPNFRLATQRLAREFVTRNICAVYGGGHVGLMGELADAMLAENGHVIGIIPEFLADKEIAHPNLSELIITPSMHTRKQAMADRADAFIMLPGGIGTLEEFFEAWTWTQLGLQRKPLGILNIDNYYHDLLTFIDTIVQNDFMSTYHRQYIIAESNPATLLDKLAKSDIRYTDKWLPEQDAVI